MLSACIKSEQLKIRRSYIWIAFFLTPLVPAFMGTMNYMNNLALLKSEWFSLWTQQTLFYSNFFFSPLIAVYCSYLWRMENMNKNRNMIMTAPVPVRDIFLGKLIVIAKAVFLIQLWVYVLFVLSGWLVHLPGLPPLQTLFYIFRGLLGGLAVAALQLLLSMVIRSFALPIAIAIIGSVTGLLAANTAAGFLYPYSLMMLGMNANRSEDMLAGNGIIFFASALLYICLFCGIAVLLLKRQDVKA